MPALPDSPAGPLYLCLCGHTGGGSYSDHLDTGSCLTDAGRGACTHPGCNCSRFCPVSPLRPVPTLRSLAPRSSGGKHDVPPVV